MTVAENLPRSVTVRVPAKINLHLAVGRRRPDGFHPLVTLYQAISLYDDVTVTDNGSWGVYVNDSGETAGVPRDATNIAVRAGRLLADHHGIEAAVDISLLKGIPVAGGMAGGSADAAGTLVALDRLWDLQTSDEDLLELAAQLGSDVPFALLGGTALGTGRGERVEPIEDRRSWWWLVLPSEKGLSTPEVYCEFDRIHPEAPTELDESVELRERLGSEDPVDLGRFLRNDLQEAALTLRPDLVETFQRVREAGDAAAMLSGSGPTVIVPVSVQDRAVELRAALLVAGIPVVHIATGPVAGAHVVEY